MYWNLAEGTTAKTQGTTTIAVGAVGCFKVLDKASLNFTLILNYWPVASDYSVGPVSLDKSSGLGFSLNSLSLSQNNDVQMLSLNLAKI